MHPQVRPVADDQWEIVAWLWQLFRHDVASVVPSIHPPYADGRYRHEWLDQYPTPDRAGYLAWSPHPGTGEQAPVGFALVRGLDTDSDHAGVLRRAGRAARGRGRRVALDVIGRHPGAWEIPFQHENTGAGHFWRRVARDAWGEAWDETEEPVPGKPDVPADHWIRSR